MALKPKRKIEGTIDFVEVKADLNEEVKRRAAKKELTEQEIETIIDGMCGGKTLKQCCELAQRDYVNVHKRILASDSLKLLYAHARSAYTQYRVQQMHDIAADKEIDPQRARLMVDCIKWEASKVIPKEYGDKIDHDVKHSGQISMTISQEDAGIL